MENRAAEHGLTKGDAVIVLTIEFPDESTHRSLYLYETAASWSRDGMDQDGIRYTVSREPWDGVENVSFDNGD